jgi:hypothetical protein
MHEQPVKRHLQYFSHIPGCNQKNQDIQTNMHNEQRPAEVNLSVSHGPYSKHG